MAGQVRIGGTTASVQLTGNDSITADQQIGFPDTNGDSAVVLVTPTSQDIETTGDVKIGGTLPAAPNIELNATDGSIEACAGNAQITNGTNTKAFTINNSATAARSQVGVFGSSNASQGRGKLILDGVDSLTGSNLNAIEINRENFPDQIVLGYNGNITSAGTIYSTGDDGAGSGGRIICGVSSSSSATDRSGVTIVGQGTSTQGKVVIQAKTGTTKSNPALQVFYGDSSAYKIDYNGTAAFRNAIFNLEPENSANYVSTTNADGETEAVYNGPTLDVKDTLTKLVAAVTAIRAASQVAGTLEDLKSAITTATADFGGNN